MARPVGSGSSAPPRLTVLLSASRRCGEFDSNRNGLVDRDELRHFLIGGEGLLALTRNNSSSSASAQEVPMWQLLDTNADGALSTAEIEAAPEALRSPVTCAMAKSSSLSELSTIGPDQTDAVQAAARRCPWPSPSATIRIGSGCGTC